MIDAVVGSEVSNSGKVALVTGGASGIGLGVARQLAADGCNVIVGDINDNSGNRVASEIGGAYTRLDVSSESSWETAMQFVQSRYGGLDVLVNNAGIYAAGTIELATEEVWQRLQSINVVGVLLGCQYAIRAMKHRGGVIINMSSGAALRPTSGAALYSATKSAVLSLTRTTALHCAEQKYNIRCNSVHPGMVNTEMVSGRAGDDESLRQLIEAADRMHPLGRIAAVDDIAAAVSFLASDGAAYLTGVALPVDGGYAIN